MLAIAREGDRRLSVRFCERFRQGVVQRMARSCDV